MGEVYRAKDIKLNKGFEHKHDAPANVSLSNTTITTAVLNDDELETLNRLLKKAGVPD